MIEPKGHPPRVALPPLTTEDIQTCLGALLDTLVEARRAMGGVGPSDEGPFRAYLDAFWLRPETAVVQTLQARALSRYLDPPPASDFVDVGCGDGIHASLLFGWRFAEDFDAFQHLQPDAADIFDSRPQAGFAAPLVRPGTPVPLGVDIKASSVERTRALRTFAAVVRADATCLPIADGSIRTLHSNAIANLEDGVLDRSLRECARVLKPGGIALLASATESYPTALYYGPRSRAAAARGQMALASRLDSLDRGRSRGLLRARSEPEWRARLEQVGLVYEESVPCVPVPVLTFWDTGLRPFAPWLSRWAQAGRGTPVGLALKRGVVHALGALLSPLLQESVAAPTFRIVVARKP